MSEDRSRYVKKKVKHNKAVKDNMDALNDERNKFGAQVKKGAGDIGNSLIPKGGGKTASGEDRYNRMLKNMDDKYQNKLSKMSNQFDALSNYTQQTLGDTRKGMSQLEKSNAMLRKQVGEGQENTKKALTAMQKYIQGGGKKSSGGGTPTTGGRGGPADPLASGGYTTPISETLISKEPKVEEVEENKVENKVEETTETTTTETTTTTPTTSATAVSEVAAKSFTTALAQVHENEGGYQKQKADKLGNYNSDKELVGTNKGISAPTYEEWIGHPPSEAEMRAISKDTADKIYKDVFWDGVYGDQIKDPQVAMIIFDHGVNAGVGNGIKVAQRTLNALGYKVEVDGALSDEGETLTAINQVDSREFYNEYKKQRIIYYNNRREDLKREYLKGWINRVNKFNYK